jgi:alkaline phosphatase D
VNAPGGSLDTFGAPAVKNVPIEKWDDDGLGIEPNNLTAINSLIAYRSLRYGRHLDLILTDQKSFCGDDPTDADGVGKIYDPAFNGMFSEAAMMALDAGRAFDDGKPPAELEFGDARIPNPRRDSPPRTILGARQKQWFMDQLRRSTATWKIWGSSLGAIDWRADPQNRPSQFLGPRGDGGARASSSQESPASCAVPGRSTIRSPRTGPTTCCSSMASARASNTRSASI